MSLQFGHDLSAVETFFTVCKFFAYAAWLQFGHDLSAVETKGYYHIQYMTSCFNSATTFQPWKLARELGTLTALIGLQFGHDLSAVETVINRHFRPLVSCWLQFGHDLSAVETVRLGPNNLECKMLQFGHDLSAVETF